MKLGAEEASWKITQKCGISSPQSRESDDKPSMRHRGECTRKHRHRAAGYIHADRLSSHSFWSPSTPQSNPYLHTFAVFCTANPFIVAPHKGMHARNRETRFRCEVIRVQTQSWTRMAHPDSLAAICPCRHDRRTQHPGVTWKTYPEWLKKLNRYWQ